MKILHLISSSGIYGAEAVILTLMHALREGPHQGALGVFLDPSQPSVQLYNRAQAEGLETHAIECRGALDRSVPGALRLLVQQTGASLVHAHGYKADVYLYLARPEIPTVSTCHTWYDNDLALRVYGITDRFVLRSFNAVAAVSDEVRQRLLKARVRADRVALIRNGIDLHPFAHSRVAANAPLCVGLVGRLDREKGVDLFVKAAAAVLKQLPLTRFAVAGDGPDRETLQALINQLGIRDQVRLLGRQENMPSFYASLDLLVSSSRQEGLPIALLEGMASALPLVATTVGQVPAIIVHGHTGVLVPAEDVEALAGAILSLLQDPLLRERYGAAGRERIASEFSAARMAGDYLQLYERACSMSGPAQ